MLATADVSNIKKSDQSDIVDEWNCFSGMVVTWKTFSLISSWDHSRRLSQSQTSETPRSDFKPAQNLSSDLVEGCYAVMITTTTQCYCRIFPVEGRKILLVLAILPFVIIYLMPWLSKYHSQLLWKDCSSFSFKNDWAILFNFFGMKNFLGSKLLN